MAAFQEIDAQEYPGLHAYRTLLATRRGGRLYSGVYVDAQVLDAQPTFMNGSGTLYEEVMRLGDLGLYALGFERRRRPRQQDGRTSVWHIINDSRPRADAGTYTWSAAEYAHFERARAQPPPAPAPAPAPAVPRSEARTPPPGRRKQLIDMQSQRRIRDRLGGPLLRELDAVARREQEKQGVVAAVLSRYAFRADLDNRTLWPRGDEVLDAAIGHKQGSWSAVESLAFRLRLGLSDTGYHELRMAEEWIEGRKSLKAPKSRIGPEFRGGYLPGTVIDVAASMSGRTLGPKPPPRFQCVRFEVRRAVVDVLKARLEQQVIPFLMDQNKIDNNRAWRYVIEHLAANDLRGFKGALEFMWLRTHPRLAEIVDREPRFQVCGICGRAGHNRRTCPMRALRDPNADEAVEGGS